MHGEHFIDEPSAIISGAPATLLSRLLGSPYVVKVLAHSPSGVDPNELAAVLDAIHRAGRAHENRLDQQRRDDAEPLGAVMPHCWTTEQAATYLGLSARRVQELALELDGQRIGRRWLIPETAVRCYKQTKAGNAA